MAPRMGPDGARPLTGDPPPRDEGDVASAWLHRELTGASAVVVSLLEEKRPDPRGEREAPDHLRKTAVAVDPGRDIGGIGGKARIGFAQEIEIGFEAGAVADHMVQGDRRCRGIRFEPTQTNLRAARLVGATHEKRLQRIRGRSRLEGGGRFLRFEAFPERPRLRDIARAKDRNRRDRRGGRLPQKAGIRRRAAFETEKAVEVMVVEAVEVEQPLNLIEDLGLERRLAHVAEYIRAQAGEIDLSGRE